MNLVLSRLDTRWIEAASAELCSLLSESLESLDREIDHILAWNPFFPGEVNLTQFISSQVASRNVYLPRVSGRREMDFISIGSDWTTQIEEGFRGIPGPADGVGQVFDPYQGERSVVLVPGLGFDRRGNWVGRSSGYYNRFLIRGEMRKAITIGVCWSLQVLASVPADPFDVILDWVCHEREFIRTGVQFEEEIS